MMRRVSLALIATAVIGWIAIECGGKVSYGYTDDDGGFHAPDGAFLWGPGSSCKDYDASVLADTSDWVHGAVFTSIACTTDQFCMTKGLPSGLATPVGGHAAPGSAFFRVKCGDGSCAAGVLLNVPCSGPDENGDQFCRSFYQQFIAAPGATAQASCKPCYDVEPDDMQCAGDYVCGPDCCPRGGFCVERGSTKSCEYPCQP